VNLQADRGGEWAVLALGVTDRRPPPASVGGARRPGGAEGADQAVQEALDEGGLAEALLADHHHVRALDHPVRVGGEGVEAERRPTGQAVGAQVDALGAKPCLGLARVERAQVRGR